MRGVVCASGPRRGGGRCPGRALVALLGVLALTLVRPAPSSAQGTGPDMTGLEGAGLTSASAAPLDVPGCVATITGQPDGDLARAMPDLTAALSFYKDLAPGQSLADFGRQKAPADADGLVAVLAAVGLTPERASAEQKQQAAQRLANVEYPLRDRAAVTQMLDLLLVMAQSQQAMGRDGSAYERAYEALRAKVVDGLKAAGANPDEFPDEALDGQLHTDQDLPPNEPETLGFRTAMQSILAAHSGSPSGTPVAGAGGPVGQLLGDGELAGRVAQARALRERRESLRELAISCAKAQAFVQILTERHDQAGAARYQRQAQASLTRLLSMLHDPRFAASLSSDLADLVAALRRRSLADPTLGGGATAQLLAALARAFPAQRVAPMAAPSSSDQAASRKEVERLLQLASAGPYMILVDFDGLRPDTLERHLAQRGPLGQESIPNLDRYAIRRGVFLRDTVTCFPSSTYPGTTTFLTGRTPRVHNVVSNTMFFRDVKEKQDHGSLVAATKLNFIDFLTVKQSPLAQEQVPSSVPFIFEMITPSALTFLPVYRGVKPRVSQGGFLAGKIGLFFEHEGTYVPFGDRGFDDVLATASYAMVHEGKPWNGDGTAFQPPRLMVHYFAWIDHSSHGAIKGQASPEVQRFFEYQDRLFGRFMRMVDSLGILDESVLVVISDHGHLAGPAETDDPTAPSPDGNLPYSISKRMQEEGFTMRQLDLKYQDYDAVFVSDGEGTGRVYIPSATGHWDHEHTFDELKAYVRPRDHATIDMIHTLFFLHSDGTNERVNPAIDLGLMMGRDDPAAGIREIVVYTARPLPGAAGGSGPASSEAAADAAAAAGSPQAPLAGAFSVIRRRIKDGVISYSYLYRKGLDPLGYETSVSVVRDAAPASGAPGWLQTAYLDQREWLSMTMGTDYPDAPWGFDDYFSGRDHADVVLTARPGYSFDETGIDRSDHGYPLAPSMRDTLVIAGKGIRHGMISTRPHRSVDMIPTALTALGRTDVLSRVALDGRVASEVLDQGDAR